MKRFLPLVVAVLAGGVAAVAVNLLLADYAAIDNDPVGKLSPRAVLTAQEQPRAGRQGPQTTTGGGPTTTTGPTATTGPTTTDDDDDDDDDNRGRGRGRGRGGDGSEDDD